MWQVLDIVARLILLGGVVLIVWWLWQILGSTPKTGYRSCVSCGVELSALDLATCGNCLNSSFGGAN
jgi:hypothetical protein